MTHNIASQTRFSYYLFFRLCVFDILTSLDVNMRMQLIISGAKSWELFAEKCLPKCFCKSIKEIEKSMIISYFSFHTYMSLYHRLSLSLSVDYHFYNQTSLLVSLSVTALNATLTSLPYLSLDQTWSILFDHLIIWLQRIKTIPFNWFWLATSKYNKPNQIDFLYTKKTN